MKTQDVTLLTIIAQGSTCCENAALSRNALANGDRELADKYAQQMRASLRDYEASLEAFIAPRIQQKPLPRVVTAERIMELWNESCDDAGSNIVRFSYALIEEARKPAIPAGKSL